MLVEISMLLAGSCCSSGCESHSNSWFEYSANGMKTSTTENPMSNMDRPGASDRLVILVRRVGAGCGFAEFGVLATCRQLLLRELLLLVALVHRFLEATNGGAQVRADGAQFLGAEYQQYDHQDDQQMTGRKQVHGGLLGASRI